ncbi:hypothetical protein G9A89_016181 [Geosiphon pyriformis]|nr:hypothetical protein G9A89_016181 [Geosiphon pyriformis]
MSFLIDDKIFFFGGLTNLEYNLFLNDDVYLDLSQNFSTDAPSFYNIRRFSTLPLILGGSAEVIKTQNETKAFIFGGIRLPSPNYKNETIFIYTILNDTVTLSSITPTQLEGPTPRNSFKTVIDKKGRIYIWGGLGNSIDIFDKTMYIYDTNTTLWTTITSSNSPQSRSKYTATLLSDGRIFYIGGGNLSQILIFDTEDKNSQPWSIKSAKSNITLGYRAHHSAVLAEDETSIIIYGGIDNTTRPDSPLMVLNIKTFTWSVPIVENLPNNMPRLSYHTAIRQRNYMIIVFGGYPPSDGEIDIVNPNKDIMLFDIKNGTFKWVKNFVIPSQEPIYTTPTSNPAPTGNPNETSTPSPKGNNYGIIIGFPIASIALILMISAVTVIFNRRHSINRLASTHTNHEIIESSTFQPYLSMGGSGASPEANLATMVSGVNSNIPHKQKF